MHSILRDAPMATAATLCPASEPKPQPGSAPPAADGAIDWRLLPLVLLITGFSLVKLGVPLLISIGIVAVAATIGFIRRAMSAS